MWKKGGGRRRGVKGRVGGVLQSRGKVRSSLGKPPPNPTMKTTIASLMRHAFTSLAGLGGFLLSHHLLDAGDVSQVNAAGVSLGTALVVILTGVIGRLILTLTGKLFTGGMPGESSGTSGGMVSLFMLVGTSAVVMGCLPACSASQVAAAQSVPISTTVHTKYGTASYSTAGGLVLDVETTSGK